MGAGRISWTGGEVDLVFDAGVTDTCPGSPSSRQVSLGRNFRQDEETLQDERTVGADFRSPHGSIDVARISLGYPDPTGRSRQGRSRPPGPIFWPLAPCGRPQLDEPTPPSQSLRFGDLPFSTGMTFGAGRRLNPLLQHQFRRFPHAGISARVGHAPHQHRRRSSTAESHRLSGQLLAAHVFQHRGLFSPDRCPCIRSCQSHPAYSLVSPGHLHARGIARRMGTRPRCPSAVGCGIVTLVDTVRSNRSTRG